MRVIRASLFLSAGGSIRRGSSFFFSHHHYNPAARSAAAVAAARRYSQHTLATMKLSNDNQHGEAATELLSPSPLSPTSSIKYTPISCISPLIREAHETYATHITHPYEFRMQQLRGIERLINDNAQQFTKAIALDLGQGPMYAEAFELSHVILSLIHI